MKTSKNASRLIHPEIRPDAWEFRRKEMEKIAHGLREKYRDEFQRGPWWKTFFLRLKIALETSRIFTGRLHAVAKAKPPSSEAR